MPSVASAAKKLDSRSGRISAPALRFTASIIAMPMRASCIAAIASTATTMSTARVAATTVRAYGMLRRLNSSMTSAKIRYSVATLRAKSGMDSWGQPSPGGLNARPA